MKIKEFLKERLLSKISLPDLLLIIFLIILFIVPNTKFSNQEFDGIEKRKLVTFPKFLVNNKINMKFGQQFGLFYNDRHRKRSDFIDFYFLVNELINGKQENLSGIEGKDNWFFTTIDDSIRIFQNLSFFDYSELIKIKNNMERLDKWGKENGIKVIFLIPPGKSSVYGEYFPSKYKKINSEGRIDLLKKYLDNNSYLNLLYPKKLLIDAKTDDELLYYKGDTHWTLLGSYLVYKELVSEINKTMNKTFLPINIDEFNYEKKSYKEAFGKDGDICGNMRMQDGCNDVKYKIFTSFKKGYTPEKYNFKILYIGDSFSDALIYWTNFNFNYERYWYNETAELCDNFSIKLLEKDILDKKPDVLVIEMVERLSFKLLDLYKD